MKKIFLILILGVIFVIGCAKEIEEKIDFQTISKGQYSDQKESANYIINNEKELENLGIKIPKVDFSQFTVIAAFMGEFNTGGHSVEITEIVKNKNDIVVKISKTSPKPGSLVTQAFSQPFHVIKTNKVDKKIVFEEK